MKLAVLGSPIEHSKSPQIHRAAYKELGLSWEYDRIQCEEKEFQNLLDSFDETWLGFSVTMPLKEAAFKSSYMVDKWAQTSEIVNTLFKTKRGWEGFNTDIPGLAMALESEKLDTQSVAILGAGATAESAVHSLKILGTEKITIVARRAEAAKAIAKKHGLQWMELGEKPETDFSLTLSTLPPGVGAQNVLPKVFFENPLFDVAYNPWPSDLAAAWQKAGSKTVSGITMLYMQALFQVRIFVNGNPEESLHNEEKVLAKMRAAALSS